MAIVKRIGMILGALMLLTSVGIPGLSLEGAATDEGRQIPTINSADAFPRGCIDCHVKTGSTDFRIGTMMERWVNEVSPRMLALAQGVLPPGRKLKGKHPEVSRAVNDLPNGCLKCHGRDSKVVPPFDRLMHVIHYEGKTNDFIESYGGECTHCHKYEGAQGGWKIHSGPEQ